VRGEQTRARVAPHLDARARLRTEKQTCDMLGAVREGHARKRPCDDAEFEGEGGAKHRHDARARKAARKADEADGRAESGAVDGSAAEIVQGRDQGMTTTYVARGGEDTSGVARATGETPTETARKTKQNEKKKKMCALCKSAQGVHSISNWYCGQTFDTIFGPVLHRLPRQKKDQIGTIDPNLVICEGDMVCGSCVSFSTFVVRDRSDCVYENRTEDARKVVIFATHVRETCGGELPRKGDVAALAGWEREDADLAQVPVGQWWYDFSSKNGGERKKSVEESARDEATKKALRDLAQCKVRDHAHCDVKGDSRRVRILAMHVLEKCGGQLPREKDVAALAGWEHEDAVVAQVRVGLWWYRFSSENDGERKQRVEESAPDEATQKALRDLAQCPMRDKENAWRDVKGDSRRVRIFAKYVREKCGGQLPRDEDVAELAGWEHEDAVKAQVKVYQWWYDFSRRNGGERKQRVEESARDEATKKALQYLAQCPVRDHGHCDVKGDSRRVRILAKYVRVREKYGGQLPRQKDVAELAGWKREDAVVAQVAVGAWWHSFSINNGGERKQRVEESARDEETQKALQYLAQCPMRDSKKLKRQRN